MRFATIRTYEELDFFSDTSSGCEWLISLGSIELFGVKARRRSTAGEGGRTGLNVGVLGQTRGL